MTGNEKVVLQGRIYPAIQSCVSYRYLILTGNLISFVYVWKNPCLLDAFGSVCCIRMFFPLWVFFWSAVLTHNLLNYWGNAKEECEMERRPFHGFRSCEMEWAFLIICVLLNVGVLCSLGNRHSGNSSGQVGVPVIASQISKLNSLGGK
jgi:hypothetical protein